MRKIPGEMVEPNYENSIVNLPNWILKNYGIDPLHTPLDLPMGFEKVAVLIIDALGFKNYEKLLTMYKPRNLPKPKVVTSTFPSTTTVALTSMFTGALPSEHGMLGYILFLKEYGFLTNMIELSPLGYGRDLLADRMDFDLPVKTVFQMLSSKSIPSFILMPHRYTESGLSKMIHKGANVIGYTSMGDFVVKLPSLMRESGKRLVIAYIPNVDRVGHVEREQAYLNEATMIVEQVDKNVLPKVPRGTAFFMIADHGMIATPREKEIWWDPNHQIMKYLEMPPGGERRMMHLYTRIPDELLDFLETNYHKEGVFLRREEALKLFGGFHKRIGDVVLIARDQFSFNFRYRKSESRLEGMHGGLSATEMLVPLFLVGR